MPYITGNQIIPDERIEDESSWFREEAAWPIDANAILSVLAKSGPLGEAIKQLISKAPRIFHGGESTSFRGHNLAEIGLSPRRGFSGEVGRLSTTIDPRIANRFSEYTKEIFSIKNPYAAENLAEVVTPEGREALAELLKSANVRPLNLKLDLRRADVLLRDAGLEGVVIDPRHLQESEIVNLNPQLLLNPYEIVKSALPLGAYPRNEQLVRILREIVAEEIPGNPGPLRSTWRDILSGRTP